MFKACFPTCFYVKVHDVLVSLFRFLVFFTGCASCGTTSGRSGSLRSCPCLCDPWTMRCYSRAGGIVVPWTISCDGPTGLIWDWKSCDSMEIELRMGMLNAHDDDDDDDAVNLGDFHRNNSTRDMYNISSYMYYEFIIFGIVFHL